VDEIQTLSEVADGAVAETRWPQRLGDVPDFPGADALEAQFQQ